jgi:division protein CdvB (Snf7/Vps24/ESCRT-III family)
MKLKCDEPLSNVAFNFDVCRYKLEQVSTNMDQFERQFENLDVQTEFVEQAMSNTTAATTPAEEVSSLMQQIADEHGLEFAFSLPEAGRFRLNQVKTSVESIGFSALN